MERITDYSDFMWVRAGALCVEGPRTRRSSAELNPSGRVLRKQAVLGERAGSPEHLAGGQRGRIGAEVGDRGPAIGALVGDGASSESVGTVRFARRTVLG